MKQHRAYRIGLVLGLLIALSAPGWAQAGRGNGRLAGTLKGPDGQPVAGARVLLEHAKGFKAEARSDAKGYWAIAGLGTGEVTVFILADGYRPTTARAIVRQLTANPSLSVILKPVVEGKPAGEAGLPPDPSGRSVVRLTLYVVIASQNELKTDFEHPAFIKDLEPVMSELRTLLNFRSYSQAGTYPLALREGDSCDVQLFPQPPLRCSIDDVRIQTDPEGRKKVLYRLILEQYSAELGKYLGLLDSRTEVFDQGYLVAGVSAYRKSNALALIVGAEIK
jgi:hypothetical protein